MIFGRPGSGKSTFASWLSKQLDLPLYHLDKYFYIENWVERDYKEFLQIQKKIVETESWIIDGNNIRSLEIRWMEANAVIYFNYPKMTCIYRIFKRFCMPNYSIDDRAVGCPETLSLKLLRYTWTFESRVKSDIHLLKDRYPNALFKEIKNNNDLNALKALLINHESIGS